MNKSGSSVLATPSSPTRLTFGSTPSFNAHRLSTTCEEAISQAQTPVSGSEEIEKSDEKSVSPVPASTVPNPSTPTNFKQSKPPVTYRPRAFRGAHASFRLRMLQEQHMEPVFISKKRTPRQQKLSEFQGGDLNKYTSGMYAIENGNEIFGGTPCSKPKLGPRVPREPDVMSKFDLQICNQRQ